MKKVLCHAVQYSRRDRRLETRQATRSESPGSFLDKLNLSRLANWACFPHLSTDLRAPPTCLSAGPHRFHVPVLFAFGSASITHIRANTTDLMGKARASCQQCCTGVADLDAIVTEPYAFSHLGR